MHIIRTVAIYVNTKTTTHSRLQCRVRWAGGNTLTLGVGQSVTIAHFSVESQRCRVGTKHGAKAKPAVFINQRIADLEEAIERAFRHFEIQHIVPDKTLLKAQINSELGISAPQPTASFFPAYDAFMRQTSQANDWSLSTISRFTTLRRYIEEVDRHITFVNYNLDFLAKLTAHLRDKQQLRNVTTMKYFSKLRQFTRWAMAAKYLDNDPAIAGYSPKMKNPPPPIIFLDEDELMRVYSHKFNSAQSHLERARDLFCFCCFSSLRYSDLANLKRSNITSSHIVITTIKTADTLRIDLNNYTRAILAKYEAETFPDDAPLPIISNQKLNDYLKDIGALCGIDAPIREAYYIGNTRHERELPKHQLLSSHAGRRTFICFAISRGIPIAIIMKWTGHSDYKAMKPYIDIADKTKADAMDRLNM